MNQLEEDLNWNRVYHILHKATNRIYVDTERYTYVFFEETEARIFAEKIPECYISGPSFTDLVTENKKGYQLGAVWLKLQDGKSVKDIQLKKPLDIYTNPEANLYLCLLKETTQKKWLLMFRNCKYIVPCLIENGTHLKYGVANGKRGSYTIAFTDIGEYTIWSQKVTEPWKPLEVTFSDLLRIAGEKEILLNLSGNKLAITADMKHMIEYAIEQDERRTLQELKKEFPRPEAKK